MDGILNVSENQKNEISSSEETLIIQEVLAAVTEWRFSQLARLGYLKRWTQAEIQQVYHPSYVSDLWKQIRDKEAPLVLSQNGVVSGVVDGVRITRKILPDDQDERKESDSHEESVHSES